MLRSLTMLALVTTLLGGSARAQDEGDRLGQILETAARLSHGSRIRGGIALTGLGAALGLSGGVIVANDDHLDTSRSAGYLALGAGTGLFVVGLLQLVMPTDVEDLDSDFRAELGKAGADRAAVLTRFEARLAKEADSAGSMRKLTGWLSALIGDAATGIGVAAAVDDKRLQVDSALLICVGAGDLVLGIYTAVAGSTPIEDAWDSYRSGHAPRPAATSSVTVVPTLAPVEGGMMAGAAARF